MPILEIERHAGFVKRPAGWCDPADAVQLLEQLPLQGVRAKAVVDDEVLGFLREHRGVRLEQLVANRRAEVDRLPLQILQVPAVEQHRNQRLIEGLRNDFRREVIARLGSACKAVASVGGQISK